MLPFHFDLYHLVPEIFFALALLLLLIFGVFSEAESSSGVPRSFSSLPLVSANGLLLLLFFLLLQCNQSGWSASLDFGWLADGALLSDRFSSLLKQFLAFASLFFFALLHQVFNRERLVSFEFLLLALSAILGYSLLLGSGTLLGIYLSIELSSLALYSLAASNRLSLFSTESGLKYFILGSFSSGVLLFGTTLIYGFAGSVVLSDLQIVASSAEAASGFFFFGILLFIFGLCFKLSLAPFHFWAPDVYDGAPLLITSYFAILTKVAIFGVLGRLLYGPFSSLFLSLSPYLLLFSLLSIVVGTLGALSQDRFKRFVAYSGIVHGGYVVLGFSTGTSLGFVAALFYLIVYVLLNLNFFSLLFSLRRLHGFRLSRLSDLALLTRADPVSASQMALNLFSMAGIPPLAGFFSKLYVLLALVQSGFYLSSVVVVLLSVASSVYYIRFVRIFFFERFFSWSFLFPPSFSLGLISFLTTFFNLGLALFQPLFFVFLLAL